MGPVFVRAGSIIPTRPEINKSAIRSQSSLITLEVYLDKNSEATGELYVDDGLSFDYNQGYFKQLKFEYKNGDLSVTSKGMFDKYSKISMIEIYSFSGVRIMKEWRDSMMKPEIE